MRRGLGFFGALFLGSLAGFSLFGSSASAEVDAALDDRIENRLQFNEYYEKTLHASRQTPSADESPSKPWTATLVTSVGYDSNATLDIPRASDRFFQETAGFSWDAAHPGLWGRGSGTYGVLAEADWLSYADETDADYVHPSVEVFAAFDLCRSLTLRESYTFGYTHYPQEEDLRYYSHDFSSTLTHHATDRFEHEVYLDEELRNYTDRNALNAQNLEQSDNRTDLYSEAGYRARYRVSGDIEIGAAGGLGLNRSNDVYEDYSDYHGGKVSVYAYYQVIDPLALMLLGGYDYKKYEERHFAGSPRKAERDNYIYAGPSLYWSFADDKQLVLSYLYSKNASNDPSQRYTDQIVMTSVIVNF